MFFFFQLLQGGGNSFPILEQEINTVSEIQTQFPTFKSVPIYNDEADPLVGWSTPQTWRGDVTYAAMVVKVKAEQKSAVIILAMIPMSVGIIGNVNN